MRRRWMTAAIAVLVILMLGALAAAVIGGAHEANIQLPDPDRAADAGDAVQENAGGLQRGDYTPVALTPSNVQAAVATLSRPARYTLQATVHRSYEGNSRDTAVTMVVDGDRCYTEASDGSTTRYRIRSGDTVTFWVNRGTHLTAPLGAFTDDGEAGLLTWEDVAGVDAAAILNAGYTRWNDDYCIMFTVSEATATTTYFVNVDTGLLVYASIAVEGETVYTQTVETVTVGEIDESVFEG